MLVLWWENSILIVYHLFFYINYMLLDLKSNWLHDASITELAADMHVAQERERRNKREWVTCQSLAVVGSRAGSERPILCLSILGVEVLWCLL